MWQLIYCHNHHCNWFNINYNRYIQRRLPPMKISSEQIQKDIDFLSVFLKDKEEINEVINACETLGIGSAEYFCEEFVFIPDGQEPKDVAKLHDPLYLDISEFNYLNWEGN